MRRLIDAYSGAFVYKRVFAGKKEVFFLVLADDDLELNYYAIEHAVKFAQTKGFSSVEIICEKDLTEKITGLNKKAFKINALKKNDMEHFLSYALLKSDSLGSLLIPNCRIISLSKYNKDLASLYRNKIFDKEYLVWYRMLFFLPDSKESLQRTVPFSG